MVGNRGNYKAHNDMDIDLNDEFIGWRLRGRHLVSDDGQRMTVERLRGIMWRDKMELRVRGFASRNAAEKAQRGRQHGFKVKVVIIDLAEYRAHGLAVG